MVFGVGHRKPHIVVGLSAALGDSHAHTKAPTKPARGLGGHGPVWVAYSGHKPPTGLLGAIASIYQFAGAEA